MLISKRLLNLSTLPIRSSRLLTSKAIPSSYYKNQQSASTNGFIGAIGNTPLIRLNTLSEESDAEILGKAEFMNPGGSVKDRAVR